jgi:hypothetical protein
MKRPKRLASGKVEGRKYTGIVLQWIPLPQTERDHGRRRWRRAMTGVRMTATVVATGDEGDGGDGGDGGGRLFLGVKRGLKIT